MRFEYIGRDKRKRHLNKMIRCTQNGQNCQKKQSEGACFCSFGTQITVLYCQKYTSTDCFYDDFAHWAGTKFFKISRGGGQPTRVLF